MVFKKMDYERTKLIGMHERGATKATDEFPTLATLGAKTCHIVTMYNPAQKMGVLAHVDEQALLGSLRAAHETISQEGADKVQVTLMGGTSLSKHLGDDLAEFLTKLPNSSITDDRVRGENSILSVALNTETGEILKHQMLNGNVVANDFVPAKLSDLDPDCRKRSFLHVLATAGQQSALAVGYDGLNTIPVSAPTPPPRRVRNIMLPAAAPK